MNATIFLPFMADKTGHAEGRIKEGMGLWNRH